MNDKELTLKDNIKFENKDASSNLIIPKVLPTHLGKFKIVASNSVGTVDHTFELNVLGNDFEY